MRLQRRAIGGAAFWAAGGALGALMIVVMKLAAKQPESLKRQS